MENIYVHFFYQFFTFFTAIQSKTTVKTLKLSKKRTLHVMYSSWFSWFVDRYCQNPNFVVADWEFGLNFKEFDSWSWSILIVSVFYQLIAKHPKNSLHESLNH